MNIKEIKSGINIPNDIYIIIEISKNSSIKYEINNNNLYVDRFMTTPMPYPFNYGYINNTLSLDDDPLDAIVITEYKLLPKTIILCKPIGVLIMHDESGKDNKIISVPHDSVSKIYSNINSINDISKNEINKISFFFENYKKLEENKWSKIFEYKNEIFAKDEIIKSIERFNNKLI